jgi:hypothetical protein
LRDDRRDSIPMRTWPSTRGLMTDIKRDANCEDVVDIVVTAASQLPLRVNIANKSSLTSITN